MRRTIWIASFAIVSLVLAACSGGGDVTVTLPDRVGTTVSASPTNGTGDLEGEPSVVGSRTLAPGEEHVYRVNLPDSDEPALYIYINQELPLYVYDASADLEATSRGPEFFAAGRGGLSSSAAGALDAQDISVSQVCPGACVLLENPGSGRIYVRVENTTATVATYTLYAVQRNFTDANEDFDGFSGSPILAVGDVETGAIETIGDVDYYRIGQAGDFFLDHFGVEDTGFDLIAEITPASGGDPLYVDANEGADGGTGFTVLDGDRVRVYTTNPRAATSANSQYSVALE